MDLSTDLKERAMAFMKSVANRSGDPFYTINPALGFRFVFVNDAACRHFGRSREDLLQLSISDVDPLFPPEQWEKFWEDIREKGAIFFETVHRHADGREIPVAVSANLFAQGGQELFGGCIHDLQEHRKSEEALKESEEMLRVIFNSSYDAILLHTPDGALLDANQPFLRMYGASREEAARLTVKKISGSEMSMAWLTNLWKKALADEPQFFEWKAKRVADGSEFDVEIFLRKVHILGREAILAVVRDITKRKEAEAALIEAKNAAEAGNRVKDRFLANMSHELRTPLTITMGMLELGLLEASPPLRPYLEAAHDSAEALHTLVRDLMDICALESEKTILDEKPFNLHDCIREAIDPFFLQAQGKRIGMKAHLANDIPQRVAGDCGRLRQVLGHLLENAIRFTDQGEVEITVSAGAQSDGRREVRFSIRDTGIGIPEEALGRIFSKFTQVDDSSTRRYSGSGLGLAISRGIIERMGGRIGVETREGKGTVFSFVLPMKIEAETE